MGVVILAESTTDSRGRVYVPKYPRVCRFCDNGFLAKRVDRGDVCDECKPLHRSARNSECARERVYGLTPERFQALVDSQGGRCRICHEVPKRLCVDHDHKTGRVRGLLCVRCNSCLGWLESHREQADEYLLDFLTLWS